MLRKYECIFHLKLTRELRQSLFQTNSLDKSEKKIIILQWLTIQNHQKFIVIGSNTTKPVST